MIIQCPYTLKSLMEEAVERGASDLHLVSGVPPTVRIDGRVRRVAGPPLNSRDIRELVEPLLSDRQRRRLERRHELDFAVDQGDIGRFRVSVFCERGSPSAAFRIIPREMPDSDSLGIPESIMEITNRSHGLVLITGKVGTGKTTTMNAMIDRINSRREARIITIEDPIEYVHGHRRSVVIQRELGPDTRSFNLALVAALRQDPNVICVGEMRDLATVATALTAAETGHLVISTLHTYDATHTVERIVDVFPPHQQANVRMQLANTLEGVISQKLLPHASGTGRVLAYEVMLTTSAVRRLIRDGKFDQLNNAMVTGRSHGMVQMDHCLSELLERREITLDTAREYAHGTIRFDAEPALAS